MWLVSELLYQEKRFTEPVSRAQLCVWLEDKPRDGVEKELEPLSVMPRVGGLFPSLFVIVAARHAASEFLKQSLLAGPQMRLSLQDLPSFLTQNVFPAASPASLLVTEGRHSEHCSRKGQSSTSRSNPGLPGLAGP